MLDLIWLIPALPLAGAAVNLFFGRRLGARPAGWLATALVGLGFVLAVAVLLDLLALPAEERVHVADLFDWITVGTFSVDVALRVDPLSITMALVVTGVGALIHLYAIGYMEHDPRFGTFFAYLNLFVFFMLMLVLADNYLLLYLGWEGVGLCSYLLIGFWYERPLGLERGEEGVRHDADRRRRDAARHRPDLGAPRVARLRRRVRPRARASSRRGAATAISLLLLAGAIGKSAQLPLHVWLPDAMEGPTPVSALIHAATMVTAGVYLVVRSHVLFELSGTALTVVLVVGLVSALYAALASIGQFDLKRALAYSTMSQIGFMFFAAGMRFYTGAMLLLVCHAFYKALLFLTAGNVLHGLHDETDMRRMGGLRERDAGLGDLVRDRRVVARRHPAARRLLREGPDRGVRGDERPGAGVGAGVDRGVPLGAVHRAAAVPDVLRPAAGRRARARGPGPDAGAARGPRVPHRRRRARAGPHRRGRPARAPSSNRWSARSNTARRRCPRPP